MSFGAKLGGGKSNSQSENWSNQTNYGSNVWGPQQGYLQDLWAQGAQMAGQPNAGQALLDQSAGYFGAGAGMAGMGAGTVGQANQYLAGMAQPGQGINPQLQAYGNQVGRMFNEQIMPGLRGQAAQAGQLGSSRAQLGQAQAASAVQRNLQDFAGEQYQADMARQLQAAQAMQQGGASMAGIGAGLAGIGSSAGAYSGLQSQMPWANLRMYQSILGAPIMQDLGARGQSFGHSKASAWNLDTEGSFSMMGGGG